MRGGQSGDGSEVDLDGRAAAFAGRVAVRRLRLGVIGAGSWAVSAHLPALAKRADEVEFVGVCRHGGKELARLQVEYGFSVASEDYRDILAAGLDMCVVASPCAVHPEQVIAALNSGAHVLCEKPMSIEPGDAWSMVEAARVSKRQLLISFGWNYSSLVETMRAVVQQHGIGQLEQMTIEMSSQVRRLLSNTGAYPDADPMTRPEPTTWTDPAVSGGGYGQAQLTHALGLALRLVPERVSAAFALMSSPGNAPVELHDAICLRFRGGAIGMLAGGSSHPGANRNKHALQVRAIGSEGQFLLDVEREIGWLYRPDGVDIRIPVEPGSGNYPAEAPANALVDVAQGRLDRNCAPGALGARTVEALALAYRSARSGQLTT